MMLTADDRARMRENAELAREKMLSIPLPPGGPMLRSADKLNALVLLDILDVLMSIDEWLEAGRSLPTAPRREGVGRPRQG